MKPGSGRFRKGPGQVLAKRSLPAGYRTSNPPALLALGPRLEKYGIADRTFEFAWPWLLAVLPLPFLVAWLIRVLPDNPGQYCGFRFLPPLPAGVCGRQTAPPSRWRLMLATLIWVLLVLAAAPAAVRG